MGNDNGSPVLVARGVQKAYSQNGNVEQVLNGVSLDVASGSFVSVMGPSGSGKSTLLHLLGGLDTPDSGEVLLDGTALSSMTDDNRTKLRRSQIGIVYQFFNLVPVLTVEENVALPAVIAGHDGGSYAKKLAEVLELVGMSEHKSKQPAQLSGGQQQRAAIARALFIEPRVLLADEPTGNVDMRTGHGILTLFADAQRELGQTIVMVTHDPRSAGFADEVLLLRDGTVASNLDLARSLRGAAKQERDHASRPGAVLQWLEKLDSTERGKTGAGMTLRRLSSVSVRNLARRKGRYALTASGIALGVAVLFAVQIMSSATNDALDRAISGGAGKDDVYVRPVGNFDAMFAPGVLERVRALPDVTSAGGSMFLRSAVTKPGVTRSPDALPDIVFVRGVDLAADSKVRDYVLKDGRLFRDGADEIVLGHHIAERVKVNVGDEVLLAAPTGPLQLRVVGTLADDGVGSSEGGDIAVTSLPASQRLIGKADQINSIDVVLGDGVDADEWIHDRARRVG